MSHPVVSRKPALSPLALALAFAGLLPLSQPLQAAPRVDMDVLGNFGFSSSGLGSTTVYALTASGDVAGASAYVVNGNSLGNRAFVWSDGVMTNLGTLGTSSTGQGFSHAWAMNASGVVAGNSDQFVNGSYMGQRAFVWANGVMTSLGTLGTSATGLGSSNAQAINASGQVVGSSDQYVNGISVGQRAFVWANGVMTNLGVLGTNSTGQGGYSGAVAINASGQVAGSSSQYVNGNSVGQRAFVWANGVMTDLGTLGTTLAGQGSSSAVAINASGQVAGNATHYVNGSNLGTRAFVWANGVMTNLGTLGTNAMGFGQSLVVALNDKGQVAGNSTYYVNGISKGVRAVVWNDGVMTNLGTLGTTTGGIGTSNASAMNASGQVVGYSDYYVAGNYSGRRAFLYNGGQMHRLDTLAPEGWSYENASKINDLAQVTVVGRFQGKQQTALLTLHPDWQGGSGSWSDASRWNFAGMGSFGFTPGAPHAVNIETTAATTVTGPASASVASLTLGSTLAKGATLDLNGGVLRTANGTVVGRGGLITGSGQLQGGLQTQAGGEVNVASGQHLQVDKAQFGGDVHNDGELTIDTSATFTAGTYSGAGSLTGAGALTFGGGSVFAPGNSPALVTVDVQTVLDAGALLQMELGGTVAGTGHDKLVFGKSVTLGGDLELLWLNGFTASAGQTFDLFDWNGGVSGSFARIALPTLASGLQWDMSDLYAGGSLKVNSMVAAVPEPQTYAMMLACLVVVGAVHKRRQA